MERRSKPVLVTGAEGFLGSHVVDRLRINGWSEVHLARHSEFDLTSAADIQEVFRRTKPFTVIHLAAVVGGIGANRAQPGTFFYQNLMMGAQLMEQARLSDVEKFVGIGTVCSYPKHTPVPFIEGDLWNGYPEETNAPYGLAKKMLLVQGQAYRQQYGFNAIHLLPVNLYGPRDNFEDGTSHVIPALIKKCLQAKASDAPEIVAWGDGSPTREFLYVEDAARAIVSAAEVYDGSEPVNIGSGHEISIGQLTELIADLCNYTGSIQWDKTQPNGQPRRCLDTRRAEQFFDFRASTDLREGLQRTIDWYLRAGQDAGLRSDAAIPAAIGTRS